MSEETTVPRIAIDGTSSTSWRILAFETFECIFDSYRVHVQALSNEPADLDAWIGKDASIEVPAPGGGRTFHGVVLEVAEEAGRHDWRHVIEVVVGARFELLKLGRDHRWFQNKSVPDIVREVLDGAGLADKCEWSLNTTYERREFTVQYGESDFHFITRLLCEEGIGFYIHDAEDAESYVFFDDDTAFEAIDGNSVLHDRLAAPVSIDLVDLHSDQYRVTPDQTALRDYDLKAPGTDLTTHAEAPAATAHEVYLHPGGYTDSGRGKRLTDRLLERLRTSARTIRGSSDCVRIAPGRFFTFSDAERASENADYLVLEVQHVFEHPADYDGTTAPELSFQCTFLAIPTGVPYRPQYALSPPSVGVQPTFATVPGGEEIHSDEHGRVKARFVWDRSGATDDTSSCWMRVGQLALGGSMILPRVDFELLVDFEMGDVDRPAVSGHLYNADKAPPYALPEGKTRSSFQTATTGGGPGANELRFEDAAGSEEIYLNASKDLIASIDNDVNWSVGNNQTLSIGSNNTLSVTADHKAGVTGSRSLSIGGNQGIDVGGLYGDGTGGSLGLTIDGMRHVKAGGDHSENCGGKLSRTVNAMQIITGLAGVQRTIAKDSTTTVSAAWAEVAGTTRGLSVTGSYTESIGAAKLIKAKTVTVTCGAAYSMKAAGELVKAESRSDSALGAVVLSGSVFKVKAKNITFEAKSKLVFRGGAGVIELSSSGMVKIKAPSITVENAKALNQMMHKSN